MKTFCIVAITFVLLVASACAQPPGWQWATNPVGQCVTSAVCNDANNHVYIAGHFLGGLVFGNDSLNNNQGPYPEIFIAKYDEQGNVLWTRNSIGYADAQGLSADANGNVYMVGNFYSDSIIFGSYVLTDTTHGNSNVFLTKYDLAGNVLWAENLGGAANDFTFGVSVDFNGNVYVTGYFTGDSLVLGNIILHQAGIDNVFVAKYNPSGNVLWARIAGGTQYDAPAAISTDANANVYITGYFTGSEMIFGGDTLLSSYANNIFIIKYDSSGYVRWAGYAGNNTGNAPAGISADALGNVYITGYYSDTIVLGSDTLAGIGYQNIFTAKYDTSGMVQWAVSEQGSYVDQANAITTDASGNTWITGYIESDTAVFGNVELVNPVGTGNQFAFVAEYDTYGKALSAIAPGGTSTNLATAIAYGNNSVYVTGTYQAANIVFGNDTLTQQNIFLAKLDTTFITGIKPFNSLTDKVVVYPNPSGGSFYFKDIVYGSILEIYNLLGQSIYTTRVYAYNNLFNIKIKLKGMFLYRVIEPDNTVQEGKLIVE